MTPHKQVCYRVGTAPCATGWVAGDCADDNTIVYNAPVGGTVVAGALIVPCGDCPREVFGVITVPPPVDNELLLMCAPNGDRISVQYDVTTTPPTLKSAWNLSTHSAYGGTIDVLKDCGTEKIEMGAPVNYCASGANVTRTDIFDAQTGLVVGSLWQDDTGAPIAIPVGAAKGICSTCHPATPVGITLGAI